MRTLAPPVPAASASSDRDRPSATWPPTGPRGRCRGGVRHDARTGSSRTTTPSRRTATRSCSSVWRRKSASAACNCRRAGTHGGGRGVQYRWIAVSSLPAVHPLGLPLTGASGVIPQSITRPPRPPRAGGARRRRRRAQRAGRPAATAAAATGRPTPRRVAAAAAAAAGRGAPGRRGARRRAATGGRPARRAPRRRCRAPTRGGWRGAPTPAGGRPPRPRRRRPVDDRQNTRGDRARPRAGGGGGRPRLRPSACPPPPFPPSA